MFRSAEGAQGSTTIRVEAPTGKFIVAHRVEEGRIEIDLDAGHSSALARSSGARSESTCM